MVFRNSQPEISPAPPAIVGEPLTIGSVPIPSRFFLAPMAGYTGLAFRLAVRELGGLGLGTTDLVNARSLIEGRHRSLELAETCVEDRPVALQLYGANADELRRAAQKAVGLGASIIDINMGCPVRKVVRSGGGSALMCDTDSATRLVEAVVRAVEVPVTVKMRLGWDDENLTAPDLARGFEQVGVAAVIVHGRTREQGFRGNVNLDGICAVVAAVDRIPVVGNGDVRTIADAERMFLTTGCAAVAIGRGALGNPFVFRQLAHWAQHGHPGPEPTFEERIAIMERHLLRLAQSRGEKHACLQFRKSLRWYNQLIQPPKALYYQLINLPDLRRFHEAVAAIRASGPVGALPSAFGPHVPVPSGPMEMW